MGAYADTVDMIKKLKAERDAWQERAERAEVELKVATAGLTLLAIPARWLLHLRDQSEGLQAKVSDESASALRAVLLRIEGEL